MFLPSAIDVKQCHFVSSVNKYLSISCSIDYLNICVMTPIALTRFFIIFTFNILSVVQLPIRDHLKNLKIGHIIVNGILSLQNLII